MNIKIIKNLQLNENELVKAVDSRIKSGQLCNRHCN